MADLIEGVDYILSRGRSSNHTGPTAETPLRLSGPVADLPAGFKVNQGDAAVAAKLAALTALADSLQKAIAAVPERMTGNRDKLVGDLGNVVDSIRLLCLPSESK